MSARRREQPRAPAACAKPALRARASLVVIAWASASASAWLPVVAHAEPTPDLRLVREPAPRHLRMRPRAAAAAPDRPARPAPGKSVPVPVQAAVEPSDAYLRDVRDPVSVRMNLGYFVDGTALTGHPTLAGRTPVANMDFATIRSYGFGDLSLSTRGVGVQSLSSYFAGRFQLAKRDLAIDPSNPDAKDGEVTTPPPIATWFERSGVQPRALWIEAKDFLSSSLAPLRVRAGELYVYGPWVMHMYGTVVGWDGKLATFTLYAGQRVPDYTLAIAATDRADIGGASLRLDLRGLRVPIPIAIAGEALQFTSAPGARPSQHTQVEVDWRPRRDLTLLGQARTLDGVLANEHVQFRARYKQVTNLVFDFTHRHGTDWRWDPAVIHPNIDDPLSPRSYLELGPVLPMVLLSLRGGTLVAENFDLFARVAAGIDISSATADKSSFSASYVEAGGALEVRLRRTLAVGASVLTRQTGRHDPLASQIADPGGMALPLPPSNATGERSILEGGVSARMSLGARKFSALVEGFARSTQYALVYCLPAQCGTAATGIPSSDLRFGGRFTVDAWIRDRLRLLASYDVSSQLTFAPEMSGYKSLRLMMEGVY